MYKWSFQELQSYWNSTFCQTSVNSANSSWFCLQSCTVLRASWEPLSSNLSHCSQWNQGTDREWDKWTFLKELFFLLGF